MIIELKSPTHIHLVPTEEDNKELIQQELASEKEKRIELERKLELVMTELGMK